MKSHLADIETDIIKVLGSRSAVKYTGYLNSSIRMLNEFLQGLVFACVFYHMRHLVMSHLVSMQSLIIFSIMFTYHFTRDIITPPSSRHLRWREIQLIFILKLYHVLLQINSYFLDMTYKTIFLKIWLFWLTHIIQAIVTYW